MKKLTLLGLLLVLFALSCQKAEVPHEQLDDESSQIVERKCAADDIFQAQLDADPNFRRKVDDIETFTRRMISSGELNKSKLVGSTITIPIVVHVLYNKAAENISDAQIQSQIDVLNEDYNLQNADNTKVPSTFSGVKANVGIKFTLAQVIRKSTNKKSWGTNDAVKKSSMGEVIQ
ncbi:hypothetical protein [Flavisolibacter tropicus]|uniref:hypothetical protein n=1 Tax=Flavisolibacter tropicus TaxID=1492898 RepID=UPI001D048247|nr:hypothetical protein [Flavisolibacter tropicus]